LGFDEFNAAIYCFWPVRVLNLNILFVADVSIDAVIGGGERVLFEQSTRLAQRGHNIQILTRYLPDHQKDSEVIGGVMEWRYAIDPKDSISYLRTTWVNARRLFEGLQARFQFECINFQQPFSAFGVLRSPYARLVPKIYTCHSLAFEEFMSRNQRPQGVFSRAMHQLNVICRRRLECRALQKSDRIIVLSRFTEKKLKKTYGLLPEKIAWVPGGVDLEKFQTAGDKTAYRRKLGLPDDSVILLTVRNLVPRMGLDNLLLALKQIVTHAPDICLIIGGDGPQKSELMELAERQGISKFMRIEGFIPEDRLPDYYRAADIFVMPTRELEGFGLVTLEALASGVPVLGTPVGGTREILEKFDPNFLFEDITPDSMAALMLEKYQQIKNYPAEWAQICASCRQFVEDNYSWQKNVDALENILFNLSGQNRAERFCGSCRN
jgi:glycosyltransferase involved in cell wall biosynthesis